MKYKEYASADIRDRSARQIESDANEIRMEMSETLRALEERISPRDIFDELMYKAKPLSEGSAMFAKNLGATVRDNPVPVLLMAVGAASLLASQRTGSSSWSTTDRSLTDKGRDIAHRTKDKLGEMRSEEGEKLREMGDRAQELKSSARRAVGDASRKVSETARGAGHKATEMFTEQPLVIVGIGLAVGALLGATAPMSRREAQLTHPYRQKAKRTLKGKIEAESHRVMGRVQESAGQDRQSFESRAFGGGTTPGVGPYPESQAPRDSSVEASPIINVDDPLKR